jgi:hypothetical protein
MRTDSIATPLCVPVLLDPGCAGRPLLGPSPALIVVSVSTPPLRFFFKESDALIHSERRKGQYLGWRG